MALIDTTNLDAGADKIKLARPALKAMADWLNGLMGTGSDPMTAGEKVAARTVLDVPTRGGSGASGTWQIGTQTDWIHSGRDFPNGTLITTSINYAVTDGDPFVLEIRGNSYLAGNGLPFDLQCQGYIYSNTIINGSGISNGNDFSGLVAINVGGFLCFWFPSQGYWCGYSVRVYVAFQGIRPNLVTAITSEAKPAGATKEVAYDGWIKSKADLESPAFTGTPTAPTQATADETTNIATTAYVAAKTAATPGRLVNIQRFTASGTYTRSAGVTKIFVEAMGGGGGGGNSGAGTSSLPGGGGALVSNWITSVPESAAVTIGAGGGATANGGSSSFGALLTAQGGTGNSGTYSNNFLNSIVSGGNGGVRSGSAPANSGAGGAGAFNGVTFGGSGGSGWLTVWEFA